MVLQMDQKGCRQWYCIYFVLILVVKEAIEMQKPENYFWKIINDDSLNLFVHMGALGKLTKLSGTLDKCLLQLLGEDLYKMDPSSIRPSTKKMRGEKTHESYRGRESTKQISRFNTHSLMNMHQIIIVFQNVYSLGQGHHGVRKRHELRQFIDKDRQKGTSYYFKSIICL